VQLRFSVRGWKLLLQGQLLLTSPRRSETMKRTIAILGPLVAVFLSVAFADEPKTNQPTANQLRTEGFDQAKKEGKQVFLIFGSQGCGWCKVFDKYHSDPEVARVLDKHLVLVKVSTDENAGGQEMYNEYGKARGVPAFVILDAGGKVLADSGDGDKNIGFPYQPHEIEHYFTALKTACPKEPTRNNFGVCICW
jgi:thiol:disulfide interchange protein